MIAHIAEVQMYREHQRQVHLERQHRMYLEHPRQFLTVFENRLDFYLYSFKYSSRRQKTSTFII